MISQHLVLTKMITGIAYDDEPYAQSSASILDTLATSIRSENIINEFIVFSQFHLQERCYDGGATSHHLIRRARDEVQRDILKSRGNKIA